MSILGVDAAWTVNNPSGVALLSNEGSLIAVAPSYVSFVALAERNEIDWSKKATPGGSIETILNAAGQLAPHDPVKVVSVDMPVSKIPITGRRCADNAVSKEFGGKGCGTHSPNSERPGPISEAFSKFMTEQKFELATTHFIAGKSYLEVYPHTALLRLMKAEYRVPYKEGNRSKYWPNLSTIERNKELMNQWRQIVSALEKKVGPIHIPINDRASLKTVEDALDAIICAWVGYEYANDRAESLGDENAAIWTPVSGA